MVFSLFVILSDPTYHPERSEGSHMEVLAISYHTNLNGRASQKLFLHLIWLASEPFS